LPYAYVGNNPLENTADHTTTSTLECVGLVHFGRNAKLGDDLSMLRLLD